MTTVGDGLFQYGGVPVASPDALPADVHMVCRKTTASTAYAPFDYWYPRFKKDKFFTTIEEGYSALTTGRNDALYISPDSHSIVAAGSSAAAHTFAKSNCHIIGMDNAAPTYGSCIITDDGIAGTGHYNPLVDVTGDYNQFRNLRITYGNALNTNLNCIQVQGSGNLFDNCFFDGPMSTTLADLATFNLVKVAGVGNVFRNCVFGTMWKTRSVGNNLLQFCRSAAGLAARGTIFEDCIFQSNVDNVGVTHIDANSGGDVGYGPQYFKNCQLYFRWSDHGDQVTQAIEWGIGGITTTLHFDANCSIWGADDVSVGTNARLGVIWAQSGATTSTLGLSLNTA